MKSNSVPNPVSGAAAPSTDKRTTTIANTIFTLPNLTESSPITQSVVVSTVVELFFLGFGALAELFHGLVSAIKSPPIPLLSMDQSAFDSLKNHVESTLGNNLTPRDALALFSKINEFKNVHGDRFENEVKLLQTSIKTATRKQMKDTFESLEAQVKAITNNHNNYTVNDALTARSEILNFYTNYNNFLSDESGNKVIELQAQIKLAIVETFAKELKGAFDSLKSKVNSFVSQSYDVLLDDDHALAIEKFKAEVDKFRKIIIETDVQKLIDDLDSFGNRNQDLHTQLSELSSSCTQDHELTDRLIEEELS